MSGIPAPACPSGTAGRANTAPQDERERRGGILIPAPLMGPQRGGVTNVSHSGSGVPKRHRRTSPHGTAGREEDERRKRGKVTNVSHSGSGVPTRHRRTSPNGTAGREGEKRRDFDPGSSHEAPGAQNIAGEY